MWNEGKHELYWDSAMGQIRFKERVVSMLSSQRYSQPAKQQVQMRLFAAIKCAIVALVKPVQHNHMAMRNEDLLHDSVYVESVYYKQH